MRTPAAIEECVSRYTPLVIGIAKGRMRLLPASIELDDMVQAGMMGLLDACKKFREDNDDGERAQFATYASKRIRGAIIDSLRSGDWVSRTQRHANRLADAATVKLQHEHGRAPTQIELAAELGFTLPEFVAQDGRDLMQIATDDDGFVDMRPDEGPGPLQSLLDKEDREHLDAALAKLPFRERSVMALYFLHGQTLMQIANSLGISESRVVQLQRDAKRMLRRHLHGVGEIPTKHFLSS